MKVQFIPSERKECTRRSPNQRPQLSENILEKATNGENVQPLVKCAKSVTENHFAKVQ